MHRRTTLLPSPAFSRILASALLAASCNTATAEIPGIAAKPKTFCNPLNLDYRIQPGNPLRREAADPVCLFFKGDYYLFASKSGGYWWSKDFSNWSLVSPKNIDLENYAPAVFEYQGALYYKVSHSDRIWRSTDPKNPDSWTEVGKTRGDTDPAFFLDDDGRVFLTYGCSDSQPVYITELDPAKGFAPVGQPVPTAKGDEKNHGWEVGGDHNSEKDPAFHDKHAPWVEGSWLTKRNGVYYFQYSAPGTQYLTYGDGVYEAKSPLGPYAYAAYNPFSFKPSGFMAGAGHSCTFRDAAGKYWHVATGVVCVRDIFERRLAVSPVRFDTAGRMLASTYRGDLPQFLPGQNATPDAADAANLAGWQVLSFGKTATASSAAKDHPVSAAFDENIKTWWSAETGNPGEFLQVDLGGTKTIRAIQVNFAEEDMTARGRGTPVAQQYKLECSTDGKTWTVFADKSANTRDAPHDYLELDGPLEARHLRLTNCAQASPALGKFAIRDLRVFGSAGGGKPAGVVKAAATRDPQDARHATFSWESVAGADGYIVLYGPSPDCLHLHYEVRGATSVETRSLTVGQPYFFAVEVFNENGVSPRTAPASITGNPNSQ